MGLINGVRRVEVLQKLGLKPRPLETGSRRVGFRNIRFEDNVNLTREVVFIGAVEKDGRVVSKGKLDRLWRKFCGHMEGRLGLNLVESGRCIYGLHCLRVSGVSLGMEGMDYEKLGQYFSGQTGEIVLYYAQMGDLAEMVREREMKRLGSGAMKLLEGK